MENKITKERLAEMYRTMKRDDVCRELDITVPALYKMLDENGIPRKVVHRKRTRWVVE